MSKQIAHLKLHTTHTIQGVLCFQRMCQLYFHTCTIKKAIRWMILTSSFEYMYTNCKVHTRSKLFGLKRSKFQLIQFYFGELCVIVNIPNVPYYNLQTLLCSKYTYFRIHTVGSVYNDNFNTLGIFYEFATKVKQNINNLTKV